MSGLGYFLALGDNLKAFSLYKMNKVWTDKLPAIWLVQIEYQNLLKLDILGTMIYN